MVSYHQLNGPSPLEVEKIREAIQQAVQETLNAYALTDFCLITPDEEYPFFHNPKANPFRKQKLEITVEIDVTNSTFTFREEDLKWGGK